MSRFASRARRHSDSPEKEYERAVAHVKRASFDALDSGIIYSLQKIELFKRDYRNIEITTPGYTDIIASARKAKHLLDKARNDSDNRHEYYTLLIPIFRFFIQPMSSKLFVSKERNSR